MASHALRIRGRVIQVGKEWGFEVFVTFGQSEPMAVAFDKAPNLYLNHDSALIALKKKAAEIAEYVGEKLEAVPTTILDLKKNESVTLDDWKNPTLARVH